VRNRWLWGDVDNLLLSLFARNRSAGHVPRSRVAVVRDFLRFWAPDLYYENPKLDDIRPWFFETARWFSKRSPRTGAGA
jgi:hypothetical protein